MKKQSNLVFEKMNKRWKMIDSMAGVGIDPDLGKIPSEVAHDLGPSATKEEIVESFAERIINATAEYAVDFKVNSNFFLQSELRKALEHVFRFLKHDHPDVLRVCDGKFADVGHTAEKMAEYIFGELDVDAVLVNPYLGEDAIKPFTQWKDKAVIVCVNTSNPSVEQTQNVIMKDGRMYWEHMLDLSMNDWNPNGNIIPVLSATHTKGLHTLRERIGDVPVLLAGVGLQGGSLETAVPPLVDSNGYGLLISSSRGIIYADRKEDEGFEAAAARSARELRDAIRSAYSGSQK